MISSRPFRCLASILAAVCLAGGCQSQGASQQPAARSGQPPATDTPARVNIDEIFPPGPGRALVLNNCTSCHTFVPLVVLQMDKEQWTRNSLEHRERVDGVGDADFKVLYDYLMANFNPDKPVPKLPKELLDTWTSY